MLGRQLEYFTILYNLLFRWNIHEAKEMTNFSTKINIFNNALIKRRALNSEARMLLQNIRSIVLKLSQLFCQITYYIYTYDSTMLFNLSKIKT